MAVLVAPHEGRDRELCKELSNVLSKVGDQVYLSMKYLWLRVPCKKLGSKYLGPIVLVINPVTLELKLPRLLGQVHPMFHSSLLKPAEAPTSGPFPSHQAQWDRTNTRSMGF